MRFQILVAIALVARISSLRKEVTRFDLEVQGNEQVQTTAGHVPLKEELQAPTVEREGRPLDERVQEPTAIPAETEGFVEVASQKLNREPLELTAESCINGVITVTGKMVVKNKFKFPKECNVMRGAPGAEVTLEEPLEFEGNLSFEGHLGFTATRAFQQACVIVEFDATIAGDVQFQNCKNEDDSGRGGGLYVDTLVQWSGSVVFRNCSARRRGGGLHAQGSVTQHDATMSFEACHSEHGGGLYAAGSVTQHDATMSFEACHSNRNGGGAFVDQDVTQGGGTMEFRNCSSEANGGGLHARGSVTQHNGAMSFEACRSEHGGGALVGQDVTQGGGTMEFRNCSSKTNGGGLFVARGFMTQRNGTMSFEACRSDKSGGGALVDQDVTQGGGTMEFRNCSSKTNGGGLFVHRGSVTQRDGAMSFEACHSDKSGGGASVGKDVTQEGGTMEFRNCSSKTNGGGMVVPNKFSQAGAALFDQCTAKDDGGGLWVRHFEQATRGVLSFSHCCGTRGGGLYTESVHTNATETLRFHLCEAVQSGGGIQIVGKEGSVLGSVILETCSAARGTAIEARNLTVQKLVLVDTFQKAIDAQSLYISNLTLTVKESSADGVKPQVAIEAVNMTIASAVNCTPLKTCEFISSSPPSIAKLLCPLGTGVPKGAGYGCLACPEGYTQIRQGTSEHCDVCPNGTALCRAAKIQMAPGLMIHDGNLSRTLHCPTKAACQGGELPENEHRPMCQPGYSGEGCSQCAREHGILYLTSDSSVLSCTKCANHTSSQILQWFAFVVQRSGLFAISAAGILGAGRADRVKNSGVFLNQLMAFAAVAGAVVTAVMQTDTAQKMKTATVKSLFGTAVFLSETGSGQGSRSSHCLLSYISLGDTALYGVHGLDMGVAVLLMALLSIKDFRVALVAGINCFLPGILADFAKYGVCFAMEEEDEAGGHGGPICKFLPFQNTFGLLLVGFGFMTVFAGALFVWIRLSTSKEHDVQSGPSVNMEKCAEGLTEEANPMDMPSHLAFLTNKYQKECRYFEAERLVRKVLLATAAAFFPSSAYPEEQMTSLILIISVSLFLYGNYNPYRQQSWNRSETGLLLLALVLIALASAVMTNEEKWNKTEFGQQSMIMSLGVIVTAVCSAFMIKILLEVLRERRPAQAAAPA